MPARSAWRDNVESFLWAVALALLIRTFVMAPFRIPSGSMHPTLLEGDRILVNKFLYHVRAPRRGDIVVFYYPKEYRSFAQRIEGALDGRHSWKDRLTSPFRTGRPFIKRLVAVGGDTVEIRDGRLLVNGQPLNDPAMFRDNHYYNQGPFGQAHQAMTVPEGSYFVLGDNSGSSHDSRWWGFVPKPLVIGDAEIIFWPVRRWRVLQ